mgnify:FL=1
MFSIADNIQNVRKRIKKAIELASLKNDDSSRPLVQLLAVTKKRSSVEVKQAISEGLLEIGENYLSEALEKQQALQTLLDADEYAKVSWQFIGPIQSNKTRLIAEHFDWVQTVDRLKIAQRLNDQRPSHLGALNICIQVNINNEESKSGILLEDVHQLAKAIDSLPNLVLRGLMCIPNAHQSKLELQQSFQLMSSQFTQLKLRYESVDTLSMGMSSDIEAAIEGGSTMVRVGTDLFGQRA